MSKLINLAALAGLAVIAGGCVTNQQILAKYQPEAVAAAEQEAKFTMNCQALTSTVISSKIDEVGEGAWVARMPIARQEYTIGIDGCGQRRIFKLLCNEGDGCSVFR